jgi:hypothetical protein
MKSTQALLAAATLSFITGTASAELLIYEPFAYTATNGSDNAASLGDGNQSGALGTTGAWRSSENNVTSNDRQVDVFTPGLSFSDGGGNDLSVTGGYTTRVDRVGQAANSIDVSALASAGLTADNTTMWMSFLFIDRGFSGPNSAVMLSSTDMVAGDSLALDSAGYGVGVAIKQTNTTGIRPVSTAYNNGAANPTRNGSDLSFPVSDPGTGADIATAEEGVVYMFAAKINWNEDGTDDEIFVFNITDLTSEPDESDAIVSDTFDMSLVNQQSLNVLNIGNTQVDGFDEIRFGTSAADVGIVPEPTSLALLGLGGLLIARRRRG